MLVVTKTNIKGWRLRNVFTHLGDDRDGGSVQSHGGNRERGDEVVASDRDNTFGVWVNVVPALERCVLRSAEIRRGMVSLP